MRSERVVTLTREQRCKLPVVQELDNLVDSAGVDPLRSINEGQCGSLARTLAAVGMLSDRRHGHRDNGRRVDFKTVSCVGLWKR